MTQPPGRPRTRSSSLGSRVEVRATVVRQSGVVPRALGMFASLGILRAPHRAIAGFGATLASAGEHLLVGAHSPDHPPFAALYRLTGEGAVRERVLCGVDGQRGPSLATDGTRIAVGQAAGPRSTRAGFVGMYQARGGELAFEGLIEAPDDAVGRRFGELVALDGSLLVTGCHGSLLAYRHSAVGWLRAGAIQPPRAYAWNPALGRGLALGQGRILIGNPVEMSGQRLGPGRVFVYRERGDRIELEGVLHGDGLEADGEGRPRLGFGASLHLHGELAVITAPHELVEDGRARSRVYVYRLAEGAFTRIAALTLPSCHGGACLLDGRLYVLGDALHVFSQNGHRFEELTTHPLGEGRPARLAVCGPLLAIGDPSAGQVSLHAAALL